MVKANYVRPLIVWLRSLRFARKAWENGVVRKGGVLADIETFLGYLPEDERTAVEYIDVCRADYDNEPGGAAGAAADALSVELATVYRKRKRGLIRLAAMIGLREDVAEAKAEKAAEAKRGRRQQTARGRLSAE